MLYPSSSGQYYNERTGHDENRPPIIRAYGSTSGDSSPEVARKPYFELVPGSMIDGSRPSEPGAGYYPAHDYGDSAYAPRIHYDDRRWSKETSRGMRDLDAKQSALVVTAASLFGISILTGTVLFAYFILSCYGIY